MKRADQDFGAPVATRPRADGWGGGWGGGADAWGAEAGGYDYGAGAGAGGDGYSGWMPAWGGKSAKGGKDKGKGKGGPGCGGGHAGQMAVKTLLSAKEASAVLGHGGATSRDIGTRNNTKLHLSGRFDHYPGTHLQELTIRGPGLEPVSMTLAEVMAKVAEECGRISGGDMDLEEGNSRVRLIVPAAAAKAIIGRGGENIKLLRSCTGLKVHVEEVAIGAGALAEQIVALQGTFMAIQGGVPNVVEKVHELIDQPWFAQWGSASNAAPGSSVVATQMAPGKGGKGKGKGKGGFGKAGQQALGDFSGWGGGAAAGFAGAAPAAAAAQTPGLDILAGALSSLPAGVADANNRNQCVQFACPMHCVSRVIGKGGSITKEIAQATGAKIMIREIEGDDQQKSVTIVGHAVGVAAAYLFVVGRIGGPSDFAGQEAAASMAGGFGGGELSGAPEAVFESWGAGAEAYDPNAAAEAGPMTDAAAEGLIAELMAGASS